MSQSPPQVPRVIGQLSTSTWAYAALGGLIETGLLERLDRARTPRELAEATGLAEALVRAMLDVGVSLQMVQNDAEGYVAAPGVREFAASPAGRGLRLFIRSDFLLTTDLMRRAHDGTLTPGWHYTDPDILNSQGTGSGAVMESLCREVVPTLDGLAERLSSPGAMFLDVGAGVGGICRILARLWPTLRVVGLEPAPAPLAEARRNIEGTPEADRIELRPIRLDQLTDVEQFDAAWLPQVFLPLEVLNASIGPFYRSVKRGGWGILFALSADGSDLGPAITRFRNVVWGGEPHSPEAIGRIMAEAGFEDVHTRPAGGISGATLILGRRP